MVVSNFAEGNMELETANPRCAPALCGPEAVDNVWTQAVLLKNLVLSYVYSKQPILGLTQEWFRELSFSRLECGVHKLHISSADWWDLLLPLA